MHAVLQRPSGFGLLKALVSMLHSVEDKAETSKTGFQNNVHHKRSYKVIPQMGAPIQSVQKNIYTYITI